MSSNPIIHFLTNNTPLPMEIWLKIVYKHKGFATPTAVLIKNYMKHGEGIEMAPYTQLEYFEKYDDTFVDIGFFTESLLDTYFITTNLNSTKWGKDDDNIFEYLWYDEYCKVARPYVLKNVREQLYLGAGVYV